MALCRIRILDIRFCHKRLIFDRPISYITNKGKTTNYNCNEANFVRTRVTCSNISPISRRFPVGNGFIDKKFFSISAAALVNSSQVSDLPPGYIPEPPTPPAVIPTEPGVVSGLDILPQLNSLGEPTLASLGLGSWYPGGIVQQLLELIHVCTGLPWWSSIVLMTICLRMLMFPIAILAQRNSARMHNHMPIIQNLQKEFSKARMSGNFIEAARAGNALMTYTKTHNVNPSRMMLMPLAQAPVFLSVFFGLRQMANLPVDSFTTGGALWFTDLTLADPFYILPLLTSATFLLAMEVGVDGVRAASLPRFGRLMMRGFPIIMFPFIMNFPSALLCYWLSSTVISLLQVLCLKPARSKQFFGIPPLVQHDPSLIKKTKKPFIQSIKEGMKDSREMVNMDDRIRQEAVKFKEAGFGAVPKTYDYDPTKVKAKRSGQ